MGDSYHNIPGSVARYASRRKPSAQGNGTDSRSGPPALPPPAHPRVRKQHHGTDGTPGAAVWGDGWPNRSTERQVRNARARGLDY